MHFMLRCPRKSIVYRKQLGTAVSQARVALSPGRGDSMRRKIRAVHNCPVVDYDPRVECRDASGRRGTTVELGFPALPYVDMASGALIGLTPASGL